MSYYGPIPFEEEESQSSLLLIDACLASVRERAGLDDDPILPPLELVIARRPPSSGPVASRRSGTLAMVPSHVLVPVAKASSAHSRAKLVEPRPARARKLRWPVLLCGFLAGVFGGVALMKSPVGRMPAVQQVTKQVQTQAASLYVAAATRLASL